MLRPIISPQTRFVSTYQQGAALLIMLVILTISIAGFLLTGTSRVQHIIDARYKNAYVLSKAKTAIIAYARLSDPDLSAATGLNLRYLPCPDIDGDGVEETPCGAPSVDGWLPWMTLGIAPLKDASGTCLRYFVSSSYKQGSAVVPNILPALPAGDFTLRNTANVISSNIVALIVAPGSILESQIRGFGGGSATECGSSVAGSPKNLAINYMDSHSGISNAAPPVFITAPVKINGAVNFNDTVIAVNQNEL